MLQAHGLCYEPSPLVGPLFENLSLSLSPGEKVALVGRNGVGKTKLLEILAGRLRPASGRVVLAAGETIAVLPQDHDHSFEGVLLEYVLRDIASPTAAHEAAAYRLGSRLGLSKPMFDRTYPTLSLGERMRASLVGLLIEEPDVLLLDEPTNHLDVGARRWLESFLCECRQSVLMVCHDRQTIDACADRVLELEGGRLIEYVGGYSDMISQKTQAKERQKEEWQRSISEQRRLKIASEHTTQQAITMTRVPTGRTYDPKQKSFFAGKEKAMHRRAKAIMKRVEFSQKDGVQKPFEPDAVKLAFRAAPLRSSYAVTMRDLSVSFGSRTIFGGLSMSVASGQRVALVGDNGCGKTTLFRILLGELEADGGEIEWALNARPAYLTQARSRLNLSDTVVEAIDAQSQDEETFARSLLGRLAMRGDSALKLISALSVGERTKVELVSLLLTPANVLLLDEPTNHLDIESLEALEQALKEFPGAVIFASHDRRFVDSVAHEVVRLDGRA